MAHRFHINAAGNATICRASVGRCPFGGEHFDSAEEASRAYEAQHLEESITSGVLSRKRAVASSSGARYRVPITPPPAATADLQRMAAALNGGKEQRTAFLNDYYRTAPALSNRRAPAPGERVKQITL
jgi:hypothetical protein